MIKDDIPRGQLSTIILMTLLERDKYGYEIIDEVLQNTSGKVSIKQPSLYSSLKRMEEQSLISSYWRDSEIGGRRHYYHLTDLGKKHLEKWKNDVPEQYYKSQSNDNSLNNSADNTKILQQQNLFNIDKENSVKQEENPNEIKKDDAFVQFDLFSNSIIVTPPSNEEVNNTNKVQNSNNEIVSNNQQVQQTSTLLNQSPILTSYEKPLESKSYNFEYVKKTNKSFSEAFNNVSNYEKKYTEPETKIDEKLTLNQESPINNVSLNNSNTYNLDNNQITNISKTEMINSTSTTIEEDKTENKPTEGLLVEENVMPSNSENISVVNKVNIKDLKNYIPKSDDLATDTPNNNLQQDTEVKKEVVEQKEIKHDDGVFITERLNPEDMPKPTKWDNRRFEYYISANSVTPDLKRSDKSTNYEDRVKELYEQSKSNSENQELELIDNKVKFTTYKDLQEFYKEQNIKFKPFAKSLKKTNKDYNMVKINKLNMLTALSVFAYIAVISLIFGVAYSFVSGVRFNKPISFLVMPIGASIYFCYYLVCYLKTPQKRIALDIAKYKLNKKLILISLLFIPLILAGNLIAGFTFVNIRLYQISIFYPLCFVLTYFVYYFARKFILKSKNLY